MRLTQYRIEDFEASHVAGAVHIGGGQLPDVLDGLSRDREIATVRAIGFPVSVAASVSRRAGFERVAAVEGGMDCWTADAFPLSFGLDGDAAVDGDVPVPLPARHTSHAAGHA